MISWFSVNNENGTAFRGRTFNGVSENLAERFIYVPPASSHFPDTLTLTGTYGM